MGILGDIFGGIGDIFGIFQKDKDAKQKDQEFRTNLMAQYDFAQHGIQWKVQDAINSGINPLAALGASTSSFSNIAGDTGGDRGYSRLGEHAGGALDELLDDRREENELKIERARLENDWLRTKIAEAMRPGTAPAINPRQLVEGQNQSSSNVFDTGTEGIKIEQKLLPMSVYNPAVAKGVQPEVAFDRSSHGYVPQPGREALTGLDVPGMLQWNIRNRLAPSLETLFSEGRHPMAPKEEPKAGYYWRLGFDGQWYQAPKFENTFAGRVYRRGLKSRFIDRR